MSMDEDDFYYPDNDNYIDDLFDEGEGVDNL